MNLLAYTCDCTLEMTAAQKIYGTMRLTKLTYRKILVVIIVLVSAGFILYDSSSGIYDIFLCIASTYFKS